MDNTCTLSTDKLAHSASGTGRLGGYVWLVRNESLWPTLRPVLENPPELFVNPQYVRKPAVIRVGSVHSLMVKRYCPRGLSERIKQIFRGPRAKYAFEWAARLQQLGITTITPLAAGHACCRPWESYLVSEELQPVEGIQDFAAAHKSSLRRRPILVQLASAMAVLHNHGVCHGDAHLANFIVHSGNRVVLSDLDGLKRRRVTTTAAAHDLKRLLDYSPGSQREHLRFLVTYARIRAQQEPLPTVSSRTLISHLRSQRRGPGPLAQT